MEHHGSFEPHQHPWYTAAADGHDGTQHPAHSGELGADFCSEYDVLNVFIHVGLDFQQSQPYQPYQPPEQENNNGEEENNDDNEEDKDDDEEDLDEGEQDSDEED